MPWCGTSNEYPQQMFSWRNKKNINTAVVCKNTFVYESLTNNIVSLNNWALVYKMLGHLQSAKVMIFKYFG